MIRENTYRRIVKQRKRLITFIEIVAENHPSGVRVSPGKLKADAEALLVRCERGDLSLKIIKRGSEGNEIEEDNA